MKRIISTVFLFSCITFSLLMMVAMPAMALSVQLGDQDFANGYYVAGSVGEFNAASAGEPAPFDQAYGFDGSTDFSKSWTFSFTSGVWSSALFEIGIVDHDSAWSGNQVSYFGFDGIDLTSALNAVFESYGGNQIQANVYSLDISTFVANLYDGSATFTLTMPNNGVGLDFSRLTVESSVPEPATMLLLGLGLVGLAAVRRKVKK